MSFSFLKVVQKVWRINRRVQIFAALLFLIVGNASFLRASDDPCSLFLSEDFFDVFYDAPESVDLLDFGADGKEIAAPFGSDLYASRAVLDVPLRADCSKFGFFEVTVDVENINAVGFATLYFHSGRGWYSVTGESRQGADGLWRFQFDSKEYRTEDEPEGWDKVDAVRFAFWRGADVDSKIVFRSFRAASLDYAILDVDDDGGENGAIFSAFARFLDRSGLAAERLDASVVTCESLKRYSAVFLPIAGKIEPQTVDALCDYVDEGGFVFCFYNAPEKLLEKLGVKVLGYVRCSDAGLELEGMKFDSAFVESCAKKGFEIPKTLLQNSWNIFKVAPIADCKSERVSPVLGDSKARVVATWLEKGGNATEYPALIAGPNGLYCSHVFLHSDFEAQKSLIKAFVLAANPRVSRSFARAEWIACFNVGLEPGVDVASWRVETLKDVEARLNKKGWSLDDAARFMDKNASSEPNYGDFARFAKDLASIREERVEEYCASRPTRENEGRLWWEHSGCGAYPGDWDRTMKELSEAGFNGVIPNMLWGGNAYYQSDVLPIDPKVAKYGDQIEQAVAAGKKYGVEVHAWMVCFNASNSTEEFLDKMRKEGRLQRTFDGEERPWLCPSSPENRALQLAALEEVATKYDVDGVHFDYIRFPDDSTCYCDGCKERFGNFYREKTGEELKDFPACVRKDADVKELFYEWRRAQITALVRDVHKSLKAKRPEIKISAAVFPNYPGVRNSIGQDWGAWIDEGLLDFVCPMDYSSDPAVFARYVERQLPYTQGKIPLYPGIGMTATGISLDGEDVVLQAEIARKKGAQGFTIFNLTKGTAEKALPALKAGVTSKKTSAPHQTK